ncbi:MAG TPA: mannose-1-phosphate guanyltransferase, partial [Fusobacteriaceae bacterium]|nr:mannose-1-phosphate guanyltransferase [Fusobacteriaceae bacterium]
MLAAFIMAGGSGERFWPLSTKEKPKQLLKLIDEDRSLIKMTVDRVLPIISADKIFIGTNAIQAEAIRKEL